MICGTSKFSDKIPDQTKGQGMKSNLIRDHVSDRDFTAESTIRQKASEKSDPESIERSPPQSEKSTRRIIKSGLIAEPISKKFEPFKKCAIKMPIAMTSFSKIIANLPRSEQKSKGFSVCSFAVDCR